MNDEKTAARSRKIAVIAGAVGLALLGGGIAAFAAQTLGALAKR